jgi:hypothetical protein
MKVKPVLRVFLSIQRVIGDFFFDEFKFFNDLGIISLNFTFNLIHLDFK